MRKTLRQLPATSRRPGLLLVLALLAGTAQAQPGTVSPGDARTEAKAVVGFRIVIQDSLRLGGAEQPQSQRPHEAPASQVVTVEDGRQVVTRAKP